MLKKKVKYDIISVGSAVRDAVFYTDECHVVKNPKKDPTAEKLIAFEFGAKIRSDDVMFAYGGGAANTAINFRGLGLKSAVLAAVGDDLDGEGIQRQLASKGVDTSLLFRTKKRTGFSFLVVDKKSREHTAYVYYGGASDLTVSEAFFKKNSTQWFYLSSLHSKKWKIILKRMGDTGSDIAWNPGGKQLSAGYRGLKKFLKRTTILILNKDEAVGLVLSHPQCRKAGSMKQMMERLHSWGPKVVVVTNSQKGSYVYDGKRHYYEPSPNDHPVDTTGAGDCYGSSFTTGYIRYTGDIEKSLKLAQKNATSLVHTIGAQQGFLKWEELPKYLQKIG